MNEIYTEADLMPESTIPSGSIVTEKDLLPIGATPPTMVDAVAEPAKESIGMSAIKDLGNVAGGINKMVGQGVMDWINVLNPSKQNTLYRFAKGIKEEYDKGQLSEDAWNTAKSFVMPVLEDLGAVSGDIVSGKPREAIEKIARRPFTYAMDIASIAQPIKAGTKAAASVTFGPSAENITARIANSKAVQNSRPYEIIAQDIPEAMKSIDAKIKQADNSAWETLSKEPAAGYPAQTIATLIDSTKAKLGKLVSDASVKTAAALDAYKERVMSNWKDTNMSPAETRQTIQQLSQDVDYVTSTSEPTNNAIKSLRHSVDDLLKSDNPEYGEAIRPVHKLIQIKDRAKTILGVKREAGEYIIPRTISNRLAALDRNFKEIDIDRLNDFADVTGLDIPAEAKNYAIKQHFEKATTHGARRAVVGGIIGAGVGHATGSPATGATIGTAIGAGLDIYGGKVLAPVLDMTAPVIKAIDAITPITGKDAAAAILARGMSKEKEDHPEIPEEYLPSLVADELKKNPKFYDKE